MSRRRDTLAFKHHAEVATLPPDEADAPLDSAKPPYDTAVPVAVPTATLGLANADT